MDSTIKSSHVAEAIAVIWGIYKSGKFLSYLNDTYTVDECEYPRFDCIFIAETLDGDLLNGPTGPLVKSWWKVDSGGIEKIAKPAMDWTGDTYFSTPEVLFYIERDSVSVLEWYGPGKLYRKRGHLICCNSEVEIVSVTPIH